MVDSAFGYSFERESSSENLDTLRSVAEDEGYEFGILNKHEGGLKSYRMDDAAEGDITTVFYDSEEDSYAMIDRGLTNYDRRALDDEETNLDDIAFWSGE